MKWKKVLAAAFFSAMIIPFGAVSASAEPVEVYGNWVDFDSMTQDEYVPGDLVINGGADLNGHTLYVGGNLVMDGDVDINGGTLEVAGSFTTESDVSLNGGRVDVGGNFYHKNGRLDIGGGYLRVGGEYRLQSISVDEGGNAVFGNSYGTIEMNGANDYFRVDGAFIDQSYFGDGASYNDLSDGTLELKGDFLQISSSTNNFNAVGNHKVIFTGDGVQTITFESTAGSGFNILAGSTNDNVNITAGSFRRVDADSTLGSFTQYRSLDINGSTLTVAKDMTQKGNITVNGGKLAVKGSYEQNDGYLDLDGGRVEVTGSYRMQTASADENGAVSYGQSYGVLKMNDPEDYMLVGGDFVAQSYFGDGASYNDLRNGTLELKGNFKQIASSTNNFNASEDHKVIFSGSDTQTVSFESVGSSGFAVLYGTPNKKVNITGRISKIGADTTVAGFVQYGRLDVNGKSFTVTGAMTENGNVTINRGRLTVQGSYTHQNGSLDLDNGSLRISGNYRLQTASVDANGKTKYGVSYGTLKMNDPSDYMLVSGTVFIQSYYGDGESYNDLTNGILDLKGNFYQYSSSTNNFNATGNHKVRFVGTKQQTVNFASEGSSGFNILAGTQNTNVAITQGRINKIGANTQIASFYQFGTMDVAGKNFTVSGDMTQRGNINVNKGAFNVGGNYLHRQGSLDLNNGRVNIDGDYRIQRVTGQNSSGGNVYGVSYGTLKMNDENDYLCVVGKMVDQSYYGDGSSYNDLTAGTLELKGDFYQIASSSSNFNAKGDHKVIFSGADTQRVEFKSEGSGFNILAGTPNKNVRIINGRISTIGADTTVAAFTQYGSLDVNGKKFTVTGAFVENGNVKVGYLGVMTVKGNYTHQNGSLDLEAGKLVVGGNYRLQKETKDANGKTKYDASYGTLKMNTPGDYMSVSGAFFAQSYYGDGYYYNDLTRGTLELKGNFYQYSSSTNNFNAKENHVVLFTGTKKQTVSFASPGTSGFNILMSSENANEDVDITAGRINTCVDVTINSFVQYGNMTLGQFAFTVKGDMTQKGNITVDQGTFTVGGTYLHTDGSLDLGSGRVTVGGDYRIQKITKKTASGNVYGNSYGTLKMRMPDCYLCVGGKMVVQSYYSEGDSYNAIYNGTLELKGDFYQIVGSPSNFNAYPDHKVIFSGAATQRVEFKNSSSGFGTLAGTPNKDVRIINGRFRKIGAESTLATLTQYGDLDLDGNKLTVTGAVVQKGNIDLNGGTLVAKASYSHRDGRLYFDGGSLKVSGTYRLQTEGKDDSGSTVYKNSYGVIRMDNAADYMIVYGDAYFQSYYSNGSSYNYLTDGTMEFKGNFRQLNGGNYGFRAEGRHIAKFTGTKTTVIEFASPGFSKFNYLVIGASLDCSAFLGEGTTVRYEGLADTATLLNISYAPHSTVVVGDTTDIEMIAYGGKAPYRFAVYYKENSTGAYKKLSDFSTEKKYAITLNTLGTHLVRVTAKDAKGRISYSEFTMTVVEPPVNTSTLSTERALPGQEVSFRFRTEKGVGPYEYAVDVKTKADGEYRLWSDYSAIQAPPYISSYNGKKYFRIRSRDSLGHVSEKELVLTVSDELFCTATISADTIKLGETVTVNCGAMGGTAPYTYSAVYKKQSASSFMTLRDYEEGTSIVFTPKYNGTYTLRVRVKDAAGKVVSKDFTVTVTK